MVDCNLENNLKYLNNLFSSIKLRIDAHIEINSIGYMNQSFTILKKGKSKEQFKFMSIDCSKSLNEIEDFISNSFLKIEESFSKYFIDIELFLLNKEKSFKKHSLRNYLDIYNPNKISLNTLIIKRKEFLYIKDTKTYKLISIHNNFRGCSLRSNKIGKEIKTKTKKQKQVKKDDICFSKINTFNGYVCKINADLDNSIISNTYDSFYCDTEKVLPEYLIVKLNEDRVIENLKLSSNRDVSGRYFLKIKEFLSTTFLEIPSIEEQNKFIKELNSIEKKIFELDKKKQELLKELKNIFV